MTRKLIIDGKEVSPYSFTFGKFRKKPVIIKAIKIAKHFEVETPEGTMKGNAGDWLIIGVMGEMYPCKPNVFREPMIMLI